MGIKMTNDDSVSSRWHGRAFGLLILIAISGLTQQAAIDKTDFYTAGVVEFRHANNDWADNLAGYLEIIRSPNATATDIIVFPEATLNGLDSTSFVPDPLEEITPCLSDPQSQYYAEFIVALSCAARNATKYIVINLSERQLCSDTPEDTRPCAPSGYNIFNTNVVFDRSGTVVSRYRKVHLYGEPRNNTLFPEKITFETDFGVTFGHMICFDILFYVPGHELIKDQGIRNFVFPSMWFSQLPFLTAVQVQQGWAYINDVNLLAAGSSSPKVGSSGTGIYHGREGTVISVMQFDEGERRLLVSQVPKFQDKNRGQSRRMVKREKNLSVRNSQSFKMKRDYLENYVTKSLDSLMDQQDVSTASEDVCHGSICCHFEIEWRLIPLENNVSYYSYRLGAYDGWRNEQSVDANYIRNCGIFACTGPQLEDCGVLADDVQSHVVFSRLLIDVVYPKSKEFLLMPNTLLDDLMPLEPDEFTWFKNETENSNEDQVRFSSSLEIDNLLTFAIYGNYYDDVCTYGTGTPQQDIDCGFKPKDDGAAELQISSSFWIYLLIAVCNVWGFSLVI